MAVERIDTDIDTTITPKDRETRRDLRTNPVGSSPKEDDDEIEIEIVDDTPEQDRGRTPRAEGTKSAIPEDEEIGQYTKGVQDRLKQMKWEFHEERRAKEQWQREHGAAVDFAKRTYAENQKLRKLVTDGHKTLLDSTKEAAESEMVALQSSLQSALETGDTAKAADLQAKLSRAAARAEAQKHIAPLNFPQDETGDDTRQPQRQERQERQVRLSEPMQAWMDENQWFNNNKRMTAFAFGVHEELLEKGIPAESPRYFQEIDRAVRDSFSDYFEKEYHDGNRVDAKVVTSQGNSPTRRRTNVAGVVRNPAGRSNGNKVSLTSSELAVAKRMGIPPELYAREKQRLENLE